MFGKGFPKLEIPDWVIWTVEERIGGEGARNAAMRAGWNDDADKEF